MTRINVINPTELTDKHLLAEYRELPRIFGAARKWYHDNGYALEQLPQQYVLGKGHMKFFYDKLLFCFNRHFALYAECKNRGFNVQFDPEDARNSFLDAPTILFNDYEPTPEAIRINRQRIAIRLYEAAQRRLAKRTAH